MILESGAFAIWVERIDWSIPRGAASQEVVAMSEARTESNPTGAQDVVTERVL